MNVLLCRSISCNTRPNRFWSGKLRTLVVVESFKISIHNYGCIYKLRKWHQTNYHRLLHTLKYSCSWKRHLVQENMGWPLQKRGQIQGILDSWKTPCRALTHLAYLDTQLRLSALSCFTTSGLLLSYASRLMQFLIESVSAAVVRVYSSSILETGTPCAVTAANFHPNLFINKLMIIFQVSAQYFYQGKTPGPLVQVTAAHTHPRATPVRLRLRLHD